MRDRKGISTVHIMLYVVFITYLIGVCYVTIMSRDPIYGDIPIKIFESYKDAFRSGECTNIILNIIMFVPFGFMLPLVCEKCRKWYVTFVTGICAAFCIEMLQLITMRGIFEVDDIVNNAAGCAAGYVISKLFY